MMAGATNAPTASNLETVGAVLARSLYRSGNRVALRGRGEVRTHAQLLENASRFANALAGNGLTPGDHVALMVSDRVEALEAYVGCLIGGFPAVHVNDRLAGAEVRQILTDADAHAIVYSEDVASKIADLDVVNETKLVVGIGEPGKGTHAGYAGLIEAASSAFPVVERSPDDLVIIGYTSGTTGMPKGVMHSQRTILRAIRHMPVHFDMHPRGRVAFTGTLSFVAGIWGVIFPHLYLGGELSFMAGLPVDEWFDRMLAEGSTFTYVPTPFTGAFADQVRRRPQILDTLATAMHSGSAIPAPAMANVVDAVGDRFVESYGLTETGAPVTRTQREDWAAGTQADDVYASTGRPVHICDVMIVDADGNELPAGEPGEITVRSDTQFVGYYKRPDLTAEAVINGRLHTGDIGRVDAAGYLYVTDRKKDMIVSGGMNVFPAEVEAALSDLPGLTEIAVFGIPDEKWGETVVAVAVRADSTLDEAGLIRASRERIASYKKPTQVLFVDALPRTASLKIDKPTLRRQWAAGELS